MFLLEMFAKLSNFPKKPKNYGRKINIMGNHNPRLHTDEILIALSICAITSDYAKRALEQAPKLKGLEAHSSVILSRVDENVFKKLGVNITFEPKYQTKKLYHN